jgi:hypothetical protein
MSVPPTWEERDLPVLRAIVEIFEERNPDSVTDYDIHLRTGFGHDDVDKALHALSETDSLFFAHIRTIGSSWHVARPTERARRAVGLWPTPDDLADRLIATFERAADEATGIDHRIRLRETAKFLGGGARDLIVQVGAEVLTRSMGVK